MPQISDDEGQNLRPRPGQERELVIGDADTVQKTTYVTGEGTDPERRKGTGEGPAASGVTRGGPPVIAIVVGVVGVLVALVYLLGVFR